ncbi:uncharacterized protein Z518_09129 [Rhinocladiella mackenziei CBS 650.93]|uniref:Uncharacterized protein n=1 Tax=Rhinocladiella mackenziei CBS 650.93 TaxID=1442369 RepID=A0A0D2GSQ5_9EURO|nr:uncharacterized protein Z518_09129 [Rhinocladiella mackenziei CBS 650.93]KIX01403.1 hypothetical protein Z518_09129 [Rhinocladiella mackenziei CBS 650.93]
MEIHPGAQPHMDFRQGFPKEVFEYWVALLPQSVTSHKVHLHAGSELDIPPPSGMKVYPKDPPSQAVTSNPIDMAQLGGTVRGPQGWIVHARSGDKASDANLRSLLSIEKIKELLAEEYKEGKRIVSGSPETWAKRC